MARGNFQMSHGRMLIVSLVAGSLAMICALWWYYARQRRAMEDEVVHQLAAIAESKVAQIANWRAERVGDGVALASSPAVPAGARILSGTAVAGTDRLAILHQLDGLIAAYTYRSAALVDLEGNARLQANADHTDVPHLREFARAAVKSGQPILSELYRQTESARCMMAVAVPVAGLGAFILDIDTAHFLDPYMERWPSPGQTGESLLIRREGNELTFLSGGRWHLLKPGVDRRPITTSPHDDVLLSGWMRNARDYRGVPCFEIIRRVPGSAWHVVTKIDRNEVEAPLRRLWWEMAFIAGLIGITNGCAVGLVWRNRQLRVQSDELEERTRTEQEIQALNARLITAQEEERARVARELHDDIGQQIAALSIGMSNLKREVPESAAEARSQSDRIQQKLIQLSESTRHLSHLLHPAVLEHSGLSAALRSRCSEFEAVTGIHVDFRVEGSFSGLPAPVMLSLYRITQEALQNIANHAHVSNAAVELIRTNESVRLKVSDRGAGMDPERAKAGSGLGLVSIRERTRLLHGAVNIESAPGRGTTISVMVPAAPPAKAASVS